jgi:hypothetical protein
LESKKHFSNGFQIQIWLTYNNGQICHYYSGHYFEPLHFKFFKLNFPNSLHVIQEHIKMSNFGKDPLAKIIFDQ